MLFCRLSQKLITATAAIVILAGFGLAGASFNPQINYQGKLTDNSNVPAPDGDYTIIFKFYDALTSGNLLWTESWDGESGRSKVAISNGLFSVMLGTYESLSGIDFNQTIYLSVQVESDDPMTPRKIIGAVPAAFQAQELGGYTWTVPGTIGSTTPNTGAFTTLSAAYSGASTALTINQSGAGWLADIQKSGAPKFMIDNSGNVGIGTTSPTATLHLKAGTADASTAPLKFTSGTNLTSPEAGAMEFAGTNLYFTPSASRKTFAFTDSNITGTAGGLSSTLAVTSGGTGLSTIAAGSIVAANSADTLSAITSASGTKILTNTAGTISWETAGGGGADTALSNLASVAINASLLPGSNDSIDIGDNTHRWKDLYLGGETLHLGASTDDESTLSYDAENNKLYVGVGGSTQLTIGQDGNVGIGTSSLADAKFKIVANNIMASDSYDTQGKIASIGNATVLDGKLQIAACGGGFTVEGAGGLTYGTVVGPDGECWLDRNLGAAQVATSSSDSASYGYYYQWGRPTDGHQISSSGTTTTNATSDIPGHANFIKESSSPYDWRVPQSPNEATLWAGENGGSNNPCPSGWHVPTQSEWVTVAGYFSPQTSVGAFNSTLKLSLAGYRYRFDASLVNQGSLGYFWSGSPSGSDASFLGFDSGGVFPADSVGRAYGFSVRCVKD